MGDFPTRPPLSGDDNIRRQGSDSQVNFSQKLWIPFIRRETRYQDYPTITPPANSRPMDKSTQQQGRDRQ